MEQHIAQNIIVNVSQQLQTLRGDLNNKFKEVNIKMSELKERVQTLEAINIQLQNTVRNKEKLSKIIVKGLKNDKDETNDILAKKVLNLFQLIKNGDKDEIKITSVK